VPPLTKHLFLADLSMIHCDITKEYQKVVKQLFISGETSPVSPSDLLGAFRVRFPSFSNMQQHDAQEVVLLLIDVFEESLGKEFVTDLFNGEESQETSWSEGSSKVTNQFTTCILDVFEPCTLHELLEEKQKSILIQNYKEDSGTVHDEVKVVSHISRWPKFVNFSFSMYDHKFPIEIPFEFEERKLFACILHRGHSRGGHYALLVRRYDTWYLKDDETVSEFPDISKMRGEFYQVWYRPMKSIS
jgi:uncharacterized UBP type Zn finger protein